MSDEFDSDEGEGIKNLRKQYEALKKQNEEQSKMLSEFLGEKRKATVGEILKAKGVSPQAAALYSGEDVSEDAVGKWLESYAEVFKPATQETAPPALPQNDPNANNAQRVMESAFFTVAQPVVPAVDGRISGSPTDIARLLESGTREQLEAAGLIPKRTR